MKRRHERTDYATLTNTVYDIGSRLNYNLPAGGRHRLYNDFANSNNVVYVAIDGRIFDTGRPNRVVGKSDFYPIGVGETWHRGESDG